MAGVFLPATSGQLATLTAAEGGATSTGTVDRCEWALGVGTTVTLANGAAYHYDGSTGQYTGPDGKRYTMAFADDPDLEEPPGSTFHGIEAGDDVLVDGAPDVAATLEDNGYRMILRSGLVLIYDVTFREWNDLEGEGHEVEKRSIITNPITEFGIEVGSTAIDQETKAKHQVTATDAAAHTIALDDVGPYTYDFASGLWRGPDDAMHDYGFLLGSDD